MIRAPRSLVLLPLLLGIALPACGGGSEADDIRGVVKSFAEAAADNDGDKACDQLTKAGRDMLTGGDTTCAKVFGDADKEEQDEAKAVADKVDDLKVTIKGDKATVSGDDDVDFQMKKTDGNWQIDITQE